MKKWSGHAFLESFKKIKKETLHGQKDLIKTSFLHEIIKKISSSNGQSHATKKIMHAT
jgi:hypothetical protein